MKKLKKGTIALIVIACFFGSIALFLSGVAIYAHSDDDYSKPNADMAIWMSYIKDDALLKNVVIPGAHDAATKSMMYAAKTQSRTISDLLLCGTRYLDIRVGLKNNKLKITS